MLAKLISTVKGNVLCFFCRLTAIPYHYNIDYVGFSGNTANRIKASVITDVIYDVN